MKMKRILPLMLLAVLLLTGCGNKGEQDATKVGVLFATYTKSSQQEALLDGLTEAGHLCVPMSADGDHALQMTQLGQLAEQDISLAIIEPAAADKAGELADVLAQAQIAGIFIGPEPEEAVLGRWEKLFYAGVDETGQGYLQGQLLQTSMDGGDINGDGVVSYAVIRGPRDDGVADQITEYCKAAMQNGKKEGRLLATRVSDGSRASGEEVSRALLAQMGKDVEVLLCNSDELALGAEQAVLAGGWTPGEDVYIVGVGGTEEMLKKISQGSCAGTVISDESTLARKVTDIAVAISEGTQIQKRHYAGYLAITKENVAIFYDGE